eukprot:g10181.t1
MFVFRDAKFHHWREIDIEVTGDRKNSVTTNVLSADNTEWWSPRIAASREAYVGGNAREDFHTYGFEWLPNKEIHNNRYPMTSEYDWFRFYKWDDEPGGYPCIGSDSCLTQDDRYLDGNNPCDGQPMQGTWKGKGACTASCRYLHQWFLTLFINCFPISMVMILWDVIMCEGLPVILRIAVSILQVLKDSLLSMEFEDIIKFFKMMKTYHDEDGELGAVKIGQLLMKHTEHVHIPDDTLQYLRPSNVEDDGNLDSDESWENEHSPWYYRWVSGMWPWGKKKPFASTSWSRSAPQLGEASPRTRREGLASGVWRLRVSNRRQGAPTVEDDHPEENESFFARGWEFL